MCGNTKTEELSIEKYKRVRTELPYRDVWGVFKNMMDYIEFFGMGTP